MAADLFLTEKQRELVAATRRVVDDGIRPRAIQHDRDGVYPREDFADLHRAGLLELNVPAQYGGHDAGIGGDYLAYYLVTEELAKASPSTSLLFLVHGGNVDRVTVLGTEEQRRRFHGEVVSEGATIASVNSGYGGYGDPGEVSSEDVDTTARRVEGGWAINGRKKFGSGAGGFTYYLTMTKVVEGPGEGQLLVPVIRYDKPGAIAHMSWDQMGMRSSSSNSAEFRDCFVTDEEVLGAPGEVWAPGRMFGQSFHTSFAANYLGTAEGAFESAIDYLKTQIPARPMGNIESVLHDPYVQYRVADMEVGIEAARMLIYRTAALQQIADTGTEAQQVESYIAAHHARLMAAEVALKVTSEIFQLCGTRATARALDLDRFWRDVRTYTLHDPLDHRRAVVGAHRLGVRTPNPGSF